MKVILKDGQISDCSFEDALGREAFRHTTSHVLAQAVKRLYPTAKLAIGPAIEDGFYYDFEFETPLSTDDLGKIENEMRKIVKEGLPLQRSTLDRAQAVELMTARNEPYKVELIHDLPEDAELSFFQQGDFIDLCAGPRFGRDDFGDDPV